MGSSHGAKPARKSFKTISLFAIQRTIRCILAWYDADVFVQGKMINLMQSESVGSYGYCGSLTLAAHVGTPKSATDLSLS